MARSSPRISPAQRCAGGASVCAGGGASARAEGAASARTEDAASPANRALTIATLSERIAELERDFRDHARCDRAAGANAIIATGWRSIDIALGGGLHRHGVHEWFAVGDRPRLRLPPLGVLTQLAWQVLRAEADAVRRVLWIGRACRAHPRSLVAGVRGLHRGRRVEPDYRLLERSIFVDARSAAERLWTIEQGARCAGIMAIIADAAGMDMAASRRIQLAAKGESLVLLTRPEEDLQELSAASTRWLVAPVKQASLEVPQWEITLLRARHAAAALATQGRVQAICTLTSEAGVPEAISLDEQGEISRAGARGESHERVRNIEAALGSGSGSDAATRDSAAAVAGHHASVVADGSGKTSGAPAAARARSRSRRAAAA